MTQYTRTAWLHDDRRKIVYKPLELHGTPPPAGGASAPHLSFETMSSTTGPHQQRVDQFLGAQRTKEAFEMWARNNRLVAIADEEGARLWSAYEADWKERGTPAPFASDARTR